MPQYIAFLGGINVGGHRVKMDRLRELFEEAGLTNVSTFIASGNVVFSADSSDVQSLRIKIERFLADGLGYDVPTFLRTPGQLAEIAPDEPLETERKGHSEPSAYVIFLHAPATAEMCSAFEDLSSEMDEFRFSGAEVYWLIQGKLSESPLFSVGLEPAFRGVSTTIRNLNTIRRLVSKIRKLEEVGGVD
jgi:uncharacterized protein (DUF1697 family)